MTFVKLLVFELRKLVRFCLYNIVAMIDNEGCGVHAHKGSLIVEGLMVTYSYLHLFILIQTIDFISINCNNNLIICHCHQNVYRLYLRYNLKKSVYTLCQALTVSVKVVNKLNRNNQRSSIQNQFSIFPCLLGILTGKDFFVNALI